MNTICLHLYGSQSSTLQAIKLELKSRLKESPFNIHLREIHYYKEILTSGIDSVPAVIIPQTKSVLHLKDAPSQEDFIHRIHTELIEVNRRSKVTLTPCGICNGNCHLL